MKYLDKVFNASYNKFLMAINHLDYYPTSDNEDSNDADPFLDSTMRTKLHAPNADMDILCTVQTLKQLDEEDLALLDIILDKVYQIHPPSQYNQ